MDKYQNKYRVQPARLANWDYGSHGLYFVTICTKDRINHFGVIEESAYPSLKETALGKAAIKYWQDISIHHPYAELDAFILMPDHLHGIIFLNKPEKAEWEINRFGPHSKNLASIIRGYKSAVKMHALNHELDFSWQSGYYDRVIRNQQELENIRQYIFENPQRYIAKNM